MTVSFYAPIRYESDMNVPPSPRVFCIPASDAPIVAVVRRGPSAWAAVGRWDVATRTYESGLRLHGHIYPQRTDVSPNGKWLCYMAMSGRNEWKAGVTYIAISALPSLTAIAAWGTNGTWSRGLHFVDRPGSFLEAPDEGDISTFASEYGLALTAPGTYLVERRRGWDEAPGSPARAESDPWESERAHKLTMCKRSPRDSAWTLCVTGWYAAFREGEPQRFALPSYWLERAGERQTLNDVQWADWSARGELLVATTGALLQIREMLGDCFESTWACEV